LVSYVVAGIDVIHVLANWFTEGVSVTDGDLDTVGVGLGVEVAWPDDF